MGRRNKEDEWYGEGKRRRKQDADTGRMKGGRGGEGGGKRGGGGRRE